MAPPSFSCPTYAFLTSTLIDPTIRFLHLGPGLCISDNQVGVRYFVLCIFDIVVSLLFSRLVWRAMARFAWWRTFWAAVESEPGRDEGWDEELGTRGGRHLVVCADGALGADERKMVAKETGREALGERN